MLIHTFDIKNASMGKTRRPGVQVPPFCPNPDCAFHDSGAAWGKGWFLYRGYYGTLRHGLVQKYVCKGCVTHFSETAFLISFWEKKEVDYRVILKHLLAGDSLALSAGDLEVHPDTVKHRACKLGWWALGVLARNKRLAGGYYRLLLFVRGCWERDIRGWELLVKLFQLIDDIFSALRLSILNLLPHREIPRAYYSKTPSEALKDVRIILCSWRHRIAPGLYHHPKYIPK